MPEAISQQSSIRLLPSQVIYRQTLIEHILMMKTFDADYARWALVQYANALPWLDLMAGVRDALKAAK